MAQTMKKTMKKQKQKKTIDGSDDDPCVGEQRMPVWGSRGKIRQLMQQRMPVWGSHPYRQSLWND